MKVLYQYSSLKQLLPISGDRINELNFIKALKTFAHVDFLGSKPLNIENYDIAYIRANKKIFLKTQGIKRIWMASPVDNYCFNHADYIATFSQAWTNALKKGTVIPTLNPLGKKFTNVITVNQVLSPWFKNLKAHPKTKKLNLEFNGFPVIGCFGRIVKSNYPHLLIAALPELKKIYPDIKIIMGITASKYDFSEHKEVIKLKHYEYNEMPIALAACDITVVHGRGAEWNYCGSLKTIESAACGTPVILGESEARRENLGKDYPYFLPLDCFNPPITQEKINQFINVVEEIMSDQDKYDHVSKTISEHAKFYSIEEQGKRMDKLFKSL